MGPDGAQWQRVNLEAVGNMTEWILGTRKKVGESNFKYIYQMTGIICLVVES